MKYAVTPPYTPSNGFMFANPSLSPANKQTNLKNVLDLFVNAIEEKNYSLFVNAFPVNVIDMQPFFWKKYKVVPHYTYRVSLLLSEKVLLENLTTEKRKSINRAAKDNLAVELNYDYKVIRELIYKTFDRKEKALNKKLLDKILGEFANKENSFSFVAYKDNIAIGGTFCVFDNSTCYYLFGGYDAQHKHHGAGVTCMWNSIVHAKKLGLKVFDFEGSMLPEVERYFREFGGELTPYFTVNKGKLPVELLMKFTKRNVF